MFYSSVSVSPHARHQDPETEAAKNNSAIIHFIIDFCVFPPVTCQNVFSKIPVKREYALTLTNEFT